MPPPTRAPRRAFRKPGYRAIGQRKRVAGSAPSLLDARSGRPSDFTGTAGAAFTQRPEGTGRYALLAAVVGADEAPVWSAAAIPTRSPCSKTAEGGGAPFGTAAGWVAVMSRYRKLPRAATVGKSTSYQGSIGLHQKPEPACTAGPCVGVLSWAGTREIALADAGVQKAKLVGTPRLGLLFVGRPAVSFGFGRVGRRSTAGASLADDGD